MISDLIFIDWHNLFQGNLPLQYLFEIALRTAIMFLSLLMLLKFLSKRGVKQLSVFELAILIALGSATGDPMFYKDIPVSHGLMVLGVVILLYKIITYFTAKSKTMEVLLEGKPVCLLENGLIRYDVYKRIGLPYDKFFGELRLHSIEHLGQLKKVYLETSGELSIYSQSKENIKSGLPIFPELLNDYVDTISSSGEHACIHCGNIVHISHAGKHTCTRCEHNRWIKTL